MKVASGKEQTIGSTSYSKSRLVVWTLTTSRHYSFDLKISTSCRAFTLVGGPAPLSDDQWLHASLPVRAGGCGLGDAAVLAPVARLAGVLQFLREGP